MTSQRSVLIRSTLSQTQRTDVNLTAMEVYKLFTGGWYQYVQISISQEAGTNMYNSISHSELVQVCVVQISLSPGAGTNMYKSVCHKKPVQICINTSLAIVSRYRN